ncbi:MAG: cyclic nucleotide-binding domain-containing protein [Deltaproteobacteria bacterium]|nr:cyclic nucleotide-binding domain-containing protein [Deltaproteobacteria bacterium]
MFILVEGEIGILKKMEGEENVEVARLSDGAFFGEMALLSDAPRSASVVIREDTTLLELDLALRRTLLQKFPNVGKVMQRFQVQRLVQNILQVSPFFLALHPQVRREMIGKFRMQHVAKGDVLIEKGTRGAGFFIQLLEQSEVVDDEQTITWLNEADVFGEVALLDDSLTTATVKATTAGSVLRLAPADFMQVIEEHADAKEALATLKERRQQATLDSQMPSSLLESDSLELDGFHI